MKQDGETFEFPWFSHEIEHGLNPELHCGLYARLLGTDLD